MATLFRPFAGERHPIADGSGISSARLIKRLQAALATRRQRRALLALDDRMLADIGLSRSQAYREASKPFLDVPRDGS